MVVYVQETNSVEFVVILTEKSNIYIYIYIYILHVLQIQIYVYTLYINSIQIYMHIYYNVYMRAPVLKNKLKQTNLLQGLIDIYKHNSRSR